MTIGIVLLAMIAAFLALRLYSVLGKRTGHEQTFVAPTVEQQPIANVQPAPGATLPQGKPSDNVFEPDAAAGVRAIVAADSSFDVGRFIEGAKAAYRMILEAYWRGDEAAFAPYVGEDVRGAFSASIAERAAAGHVLDNRLVAINNAVISDARVDEGEAVVTVRFEADIAAVTRDGEGKVIAGSLSDAVPTQDSWTFTRKLRASDPDWTLVETDASA